MTASFEDHIFKLIYLNENNWKLFRGAQHCNMRHRVMPTVKLKHLIVRTALFKGMPMSK